MLEISELASQVSRVGREGRLRRSITSAVLRHKNMSRLFFRMRTSQRPGANPLISAPMQTFS